MTDNRSPRKPGKYQVQRVFEDAAGTTQSVPTDPETFFVLRRSDVFAAQALFGYAHTIQSVLEIDGLPGRSASLTPEEANRLRELADYVFDLAVTWSRQATKLPD